MTHLDNIAGVVLAGGQSKRFGSNKALALWQGRRLIDHAVTTLSNYFSECIITTNNTSLFSDMRDGRLIKDIVPNRGPLGGIVTAFHHTTKNHLFVLACDTIIDCSVMKALIKQRRTTATIASIDGKPHYLCGIYSRDLEPLFRECLIEGQTSVRKALATIQGITFVELPRTSIININMPCDLIYIERKRESAHAL